MPNTTFPYACSGCNGSGYEALDVLCKTCFGGGSLPITGAARWSAKMAYDTSIVLSDLSETVSDMQDKINDIMDKCNDIFEKIKK